MRMSDWSSDVCSSDRHALAGHHPGERKGLGLVDVLRRLRQFVDPLDEQDDLLLLARDRQPVAAEAQFGTGGTVDVGDGLAAAVEVETEPLQRRDAHMAPVAAADRDRTSTRLNSST